MPRIIGVDGLIVIPNYFNCKGKKSFMRRLEVYTVSWMVFFSNSLGSYPT